MFVLNKCMTIMTWITWYGTDYMQACGKPGSI